MDKTLPQTGIDQLLNKPKFVLPNSIPEKTPTQLEKDAYHRLSSMYKGQGMKDDDVRFKLKDHPGSPPYVPPAPKVEPGSQIVERIVVREMTVEEIKARYHEIMAAENANSAASGDEGKRTPPVSLPKAPASSPAPAPEAPKVEPVAGATPPPPTAPGKPPGPPLASLPAELSGEAWDDKPIETPATGAPAPSPAPAHTPAPTPKPKK